jgi:hypothetical protein
MRYTVPVPLCCRFLLISATGDELSGDGDDLTTVKIRIYLT